MPQSVPEASASGRLPPLVRRYLDWALPRDSDAVRQILITQTGEMFRKPGAKAVRFTASERFAVDRVAFCWEARFAVARVISLKVVDRCSHGRGALTLRVLGVPVQRQSGAEVDVGEAYRYLAELPWVPHAMAMNPELEWHEVDERRVDGATTVGDVRPWMRFDFNEAGEIVRCTADARPGAVAGQSVRAGWGGCLSDYEALGSIRAPTRAEVYWDLTEGRFVYWRGEITSAQALDEPYAEGD